jgi:hypothetical protein
LARALVALPALLVAALALVLSALLGLALTGLLGLVPGLLLLAFPNLFHRLYSCAARCRANKRRVIIFVAEVERFIRSARSLLAAAG